MFSSNQPRPSNQVSCHCFPASAGVGTLTYTAGGLFALFFWLLWGDFALSLKERSVPTTLQVLLKQFKASDLIAGLLIGTLPQLLGVLLSPVISYRSDRHRGRFGRRIPYLFIPTPIAVLSMVGLAYSPILGRWLHHSSLGASFSENGMVLLCFAAFWMLFEFASIVCGSVIAGLINDVVPQPAMGRFYALFRMFSLAPGMAFGWWLLGSVETHYVPIFLGIGTLYGVSFTLMCLFVREGEYPPPPPEPAPSEATSQRAHDIRAAWHSVTQSPGLHSIQRLLWFLLPQGVRTYTRECFTNSYYRWYFASNALIGMGFQAIMFYIYFAQSVGLDLGTLGKYFTLQLFCSWLLALPIGWLCDKIHPIRVTIISLVLYALATLASFFLIHDARTCGIAQVVCGSIAGSWFTASAPLGASLLPKMKFATFASASALVSGIGAMLISPIYGRVLDVIHHEYRYIFLFACVFTVMSLLATLVVYRKFMAYGGPQGYVAPL